MGAPSCRELSADRIVEILDEEPGHELTLGRIAHLLGRSVRYVHSVVTEDPRIVVDLRDAGDRVGNILASTSAARKREAQ